MGPRPGERSDQEHGFSTRAIHVGSEPDPTTGAVVPPIVLSTTFAQSAVGVHQGFEYARSGNPTRAALERCVASLEGADHGFAFSSGLAAEDVVLRLLTAGEGVMLSADAYGGTYRLVTRVHGGEGRPSVTANLYDLDAVAGAWRDDLKMIWVETPTNPMLSIADISALASFAHERGAICVVDNTFATPYLQQPLALGADVVVHSSTKYLGGHSDVVGGFAATNDPALAERIGFLQNAAGGVPGPFDCYLVLRGVKTLAVRMDRSSATAHQVAEFLASSPAVSGVLYPGLPDHPGHATAAKQMRGFGAMVSFTVAAGEQAAVDLCARTRLFTLAESLGAVESLIEHPYRMTHASTASSPVAVDPTLVRLSVGLEDPEDLIEDLRQALEG